MKKFIFLILASAFIVNISPITVIAKSSISSDDTPVISPRFFMDLETGMLPSKSNLVDVRVKYTFQDGYNQIQRPIAITEIASATSNEAQDPVITDYMLSSNRKSCTVYFKYKSYTSSTKYVTKTDSVTFKAPY